MMEIRVVEREEREEEHSVGRGESSCEAREGKQQKKSSCTSVSSQDAMCGCGVLDMQLKCYGYLAFLHLLGPRVTASAIASQMYLWDER